MRFTDFDFQQYTNHISYPAKAKKHNDTPDDYIWDLKSTGHLVEGVQLKIHLPEKCKNIDPRKIIKEVIFDFNLTTMFRCTGEWIDIYNRLILEPEKYEQYCNLIRVKKVTNKRMTEYVCNLIIPFFGNTVNKDGIKVPIVCLNYSETLLKVVLEDSFMEIKPEIECIADVHCLFSFEHKKFVQLGHEYVVQQIGWNEFEADVGKTDAKLQMWSPVKYMVWFAYDEKGNYVKIDRSDFCINGASFFNGERSYEVIQTFQKAFPGQFVDGNVYSFSIKPFDNTLPFGTVNMSRIDDQKLTVCVDQKCTVRVYFVYYNVMRIMSGRVGFAYEDLGNGNIKVNGAP